MQNKIGIYLDQNSKLPLTPKFLAAFIYCPNIQNFKKAITDFYEGHKQLPELISISHDLTDDHLRLELRRPIGRKIEYEMFSSDTGLHAAIWLRDFCVSNKVFLNRVVVHGPNDDGNNHIINAINEYYKMCGQDSMTCYIQRWQYEN